MIRQQQPKFKFYARSTGVKAVGYACGPELDEQKQLVELWAKQTGVTIVKWFTDTCSNTTAFRRRLGLLQALYEPHLQALDFVLVARKSAVATKAMSFLMIDRLLAKKKCRMFAVEHSDPPVELAALHKLSDALDEYVNDIASMRVRGMTARRKSLGLLSGDNAGYRRTERGRAVLRYIRTRVRQGTQFKTIAAELNRGMISKPFHGRWWTADAVRHAYKSCISRKSLSSSQSSQLGTS